MHLSLGTRVVLRLLTAHKPDAAPSMFSSERRARQTQTNKRYVWITPSFRIKTTATLWLVFWKHSLKTNKKIPKPAVSAERTETSLHPFQLT